MSHQRSLSDEGHPFLEPPHSHNPSNISHLAGLPKALLAQLPSELHLHLWSLQESTSILYASHTRLQSLLASRMDRLTPLPGTYNYSESALFNYTNQMAAERSYLLNDAYPDWRHKLQSVMCRFSPYSENYISFRGESITIQEWIDRLCSTAETWSDTARDTEISDFDEAEVVSELHFSQARQLAVESERQVCGG